MANSPEDRYIKGINLLRNGAYKEALTVFNQLIKEFPEEADYYSERGVVKFHLQIKEEALNDMDIAVELQPQKSYRYSSRAYIRGFYGMTDEAITDYKKAIELDPEDAIAHNNLGLLEEKLGYQNKAQQHFKKADSLMKDSGIDGRKDLGLKGPEIPARNIQKEIDQEKDERSIWNVLKTLSSEEGRRSFKKFLRSGFKNT